MSDAIHKVCIHASCVALSGRGVLLMGPSGVGKSDVAMRLIDGGAELVSDDRTDLWVQGDTLLAAPPPTLAGLLEIRPVGLVRLPFRDKETPVALCVALHAEDEQLERLPQALYHSLLDQKVRKIDLPGRAASTPAVIRAVLSGTIENV